MAQSVDLAWGIAMTPLHQAISQGQWMEARRLVAQGHVANQDTVGLVRQQDTLAGLGLLLDMGLEPVLLPGSPWWPYLDRARAQALQDALDLDLDPPSTGAGTGRSRL